VARRFLRCGDLHFGFARIRCPDCRHEMFVAFSCQQRCLCPSCHQKRTLLAAETIADTICAAVPHRQLVFTNPKIDKQGCEDCEIRLVPRLSRLWVIFAVPGIKLPPLDPATKSRSHGLTTPHSKMRPGQDKIAISD
jgi:ribosomal protein S27E